MVSSVIPWSRRMTKGCTATEMIPTIEMIAATEMTPNHHRNDTGGHYQNDPRNIGNGIKRTTKTGQQFSVCFYFFCIFLRCVIYLYRTLFAVNCFFLLFFLGGGGGGFNTRLYLFKRCNSLMSSISSNFFLIFGRKRKVAFGIMVTTRLCATFASTWELTLLSWSEPTFIFEFLSDIKE